MKVLVADDDVQSRRHLENLLCQAGYEVVSAGDGNEALAILKAADAPSLAIMDWVMPGIDGTSICERIKQLPGGTGIYTILLTTRNLKSEIVEGFAAGADNYLIKPFDRDELLAHVRAGARIVELQKSLTERVKELEQVIVERNRAEEALRKLALTDELTGLYNRRGFFAFARHYVKFAARAKQTALVFYIDLDELKQINDTLGHAEGSLALMGTAAVLRDSFRQTDIIGRLGGDEFVVLAINSTLRSERVILARLEKNLKIYNGNAGHKHHLSISYGVFSVRPEENYSLDYLVEQADRLMYEQKRKKKAANKILKQTSSSKNPKPDSLL